MSATGSYKNGNVAFAAYQPAIVHSIVKAADPERIFLLGLKTQRIQASSIFNSAAGSSASIVDLWLLVLLHSFGDKSRQEWQDKIEAYCSLLVPTTTIVMKAPVFKEWVIHGDQFANTILQQAEYLYSIADIPYPGIAIAGPVDAKELESVLSAGINKAREFLAGASSTGSESSITCRHLCCINLQSNYCWCYC